MGANSSCEPACAAATATRLIWAVMSTDTTRVIEKARVTYMLISGRPTARSSGRLIVQANT